VAKPPKPLLKKESLAQMRALEDLADHHAENDDGVRLVDLAGGGTLRKGVRAHPMVSSCLFHSELNRALSALGLCSIAPRGL
jgi:hypothetical protein